ncbi:hypothetical protein OCU04_001782 [Sclerotinia nivalis]|uniref:Uncharacterized protein n=1 Tax=Sclerotinia nivalis TaxID=352851 RepID=A0A9X0DRC7_9HELO|nr:hypothetical protein OCU04_001782 [Sclerotinia nivalis]
MSNSILKLSRASSNYSQRPPPALGSIRAILLENCTTRLFVHPFEWTADHFHTLNVELVISVNLEEPITEDIKSQIVENRIVKGALQDINGCHLVRRDNAIRSLVIGMGKIQNLQLEWKRLHFMYENQIIAKLHHILVAQSQSASEIDSRFSI